MAKTSFYSSSGATSTETDAIEGSVNAAAASQAAAATSETNAAASATSAASSASSASSSSSSATTAKTASETAKTASETAKTASEAARDLALTYRDAAAASSSTSTTKANEASTSATAAASSATAAASSASAASSSQSAAASSATSAASSAASLTDEAIQDIVGAMMSGNTESGITVDYQDSDGTIDFTIGTLNQSTSGNAATATALQTTRTIHGVSFDGTSNIDLSEVISDTVGAMFSSNTESGITVTYQDSDNTIDLTVGTLNQDTTGLAATATALATARTIGGTSFDGTSNIDVALATLATNVVVTDNESGNNDCAITFVNDLDGAASIGLQSDGNLFYNPSTGTLTVENISVSGTQTIVDSVTMNASNQVVFEGSSADAHETFLTSINATADRTISLPNVSGTLPVLAAVSDTQITSTPEELNILDGVTSTAAEINLLDGSSANTVVNSKAVIYGSSGELAGALSTAAQPNITSVGTLTALTGGTGDFNWDSNTLVVDSSTNRVGIGNAAPDVSLDLGSNTDAVHMPSGTTAQRPASPAAGYFRYNSETSQMELYTDEWGAVAGSGGSGSAVETQIFVGDGSDVTFTLTTAPANENDLIVMIDGVFQDHSVYSLSGNVLTFATAPANTRKITVYHFVGAVGGSNHSIATMTGNNSTDTLNLPTAPVHENNVQVYFDGIYQSKSNFSVSGTTITFSTAPPTGVLVEAILAKATNISTATQLVDADSDTLIQCEEGTDDDTIRFDVAGTEVLTIAEGASNTEIKFKGTAPALIIGDAGAEDTKIVFDGNAQDYYIGLDDSADDLVIGKGSAVGTTPAISIDSSEDVTLAGHLVFADSKNAKFGAGSDLQIYHDGSNSYIADSGTGALLIASNDFQILNAAASENMITCAENGAVNLYYDNALKLNTRSTGIDINDQIHFPHSVIGDDLFDTDSLGLACDHTESMGFGIENADGSFTERMRLSNSGDLSLLTDGAEIQLYYTESRKFITNSGASVTIKQIDNNTTNAYIDFTSWTDSSLMRLKNHGGLLFGTTTNQLYDSTSETGIVFHDDNSYGSCGAHLEMANSADSGWSLQYLQRFNWNSGDDGRFLQFAINGGSDVGNITYDGTNFAVTNGSDYRLKENIVDYTGGLAKINALKVRSFNKKEGASKDITQQGFIAHELSEHIPNAVIGTKDAMKVDETGETVPDYQQVTREALVPYLVSAIQEQQTIIDDLKSRLKTLEDA